MSFDEPSTTPRRTVDRRTLLGAVTGAGLLAACGTDESSSNATTTSAASTTSTEASTTTAAATANTPPGPPPGGGSGPGAPPSGGAPTAETKVDASAGECEPTPTETAGPYPGDGSNGPDILAEDGVVHADLTSSIGSASGKAEGVPLTIKLKLVDNANGCAAMSGAAVYLWHAKATGEYSMYSTAIASENFLRGVQSAGADGVVTFKSIFPGCYDGRWPHIHYEVYASEAEATGGGDILLTSQIALPEDMCKTVYADSRYPTSANNLTRVTLDSDMVFGDGADSQLATATGNATAGVTIEVTAAV